MSHYEPDEITAREDLCRFLSACFCEPTMEFAQENLFASIRIAATRVSPALAVCASFVEQDFVAQDLQTLLVDYTRLFLGPTQALAMPYESSWLKPATMPEGNPSEAILNLYHEGGFELEDNLGDLPDHIALELEFLYLLTFRLHRAREAGQTAESVTLQTLRDRFLGAHLGAWISPFCAAMQAHAQTAFYRELAQMTERFVHIIATGEEKP